MQSTLNKLVKGRSVLLLGFGQEGRSTFRLLTQLGGYRALDIADFCAGEIDIHEGHKLITGDDYLNHIDNYDIVFKSPGVVLPKPSSEYKARIVSQVDLFLAAYSKQTIGVTGTKGKSTVSTLIHHILETAGKKAVLAGNIGTPVFDILPQIESDTIIVLELSSHQLETCHHSPHRAILLNVFQDHLDHYPSYQHYRQAKYNIFKHQTSADFLYYSPQVFKDKLEAQSTVITVTNDCLPEGFKIEQTSLLGRHNLLNLAFTYVVCGGLEISQAEWLKAVFSFEPLPHRLEFVGNFNGVDYYDDSISTAAESCISALRSIPHAKNVLVGGMDRGIDYASLVDFLLNSQLDYVVLMYETGARIDKLLSKCAKPANSTKFKLVADMHQAVDFIKAHARSGTACILSPAAASYGDFKNFVERGNAFRDMLH